MLGHELVVLNEVGTQSRIDTCAHRYHQYLVSVVSRAGVDAPRPLSCPSLLPYRLHIRTVTRAPPSSW